MSVTTDQNLYYTGEEPAPKDNVEHYVDRDVGKVEAVVPDTTREGRVLVRVAWRSGYTDHHLADELIKLKVG